MTPRSVQTECASRCFQIKRLAAEVLSVMVAGGWFALLANQLSPAGLELTRDYFPKSPSASKQSAASREAQIHARRLQTIRRETVAQLFASLEYASERIVFIDARSEDLYRKGHIPGAIAFDYYRPETAIATVLPACLSATSVVVYCAGGECEDGELAALSLVNSGVSSNSLFIYIGGITDWQSAGQPVEIGSRRSGHYLPAKP